ncbi:MAG: HEAT repeat domain-containing protein, partial [Deltaproteobacteria bacterium]|nr:HEAT repeat domain-containing protein [Deltaproteobacteria bacterium]
TKIVARLGDPSSRRGALAVLAEVSAPAAADQLIGLARNSSGDVRLEAIRALGVTAGSASAAARARLTLGKLLKTRDRALRAAACTALASSAEASAARRRPAYWAAVELLRSRDQVVRGACAMAAARLSPRLFARELYRVRRDRSRPVRLGLARGLRAVPGKDALGLLVSLSRSKDAEIRARAARSLAARSEPEAAEAHRRLLADAEASVRRAALEGVPASEIPRAALDDPSSDVRVLAVRKLVAAGRAEGLAVVLARRMDAADEAERLRLACAWLSVRQAQGRR